MAQPQKSEAESSPSKSPSKVLYRKYRPTKLENVVGQDSVTRVLKNAITEDKIAHAFLFIGPRGTGKTSVARIFAHEVNHFPYEVEDNYLDIIEIDAASNTGVDNIRELREKAIIAPAKGKYKVYIIDEVHMLTKSASNALLKTLEEPPEHVIFILATTDAHKVPITISSRTQVFQFKLADSATMMKHLRAIVNAENIKIIDDALRIVVRRGGGSFRDSLSLLDQIANLASHENQEISADDLNRALGLPQDEIIRELLDAYAAKNAEKIQKSLKNLLNSGIRPEVLVAELIDTIIAAPKPELLPLLAALPEVAAPFPEAKLLLAFLSSGSVGSSQEDTNRQEESSKSSLENPELRRERVRDTRNDGLARRASQEASTDSPSGDVSFHQPISLRPPLTPENFTWEAFLERIRELNAVICGHLARTDHDFDGATLHLYPRQSLIKSILEKPNNRQILVSELGKIALTIHEIGDQKTKDDQFSQISAIMGNIQEVSGELPF